MKTKKLDFLPFLISSTALYFKMSGLKLFKEMNFEITPEQFGILYVLNNENGLYQREIAKILLKDRPNITRLIDILEEKKLVYREINEKNRRITKIFITEIGKQKFENILPVILENRKKAMSGLSDEDIDNLKRILDKLRCNLEETFELQF